MHGSSRVHVAYITCYCKFFLCAIHIWNPKLYHDWRSVRQSVLVSSTILGSKTRFLFCQTAAGFFKVGRPLCIEDSSVTIVADPRQYSHSRVWVLRELRPYFTLSDSTLPQPEGLGLYLYHPETRWLSYTPRHCIPFSLPPNFHSDTVEVF
jgi:hypothetical protein